MKGLVICVDFDGTIVKHRYPEIGEACRDAIRVMKRLVSAGHKIIIHTMRSGMEAQEAADYLVRLGIEPWGFNVNPGQKHWSESPKVFGNIYIDDAALGCPLITVVGERPWVDWPTVEAMLESMGVFE